MSRWANENKYDELFAAASSTYGVGVPILKAIAAAESEFLPTAYRAEPQINDASRGIMQVLLATARGLGYTGSPDGLFDPATSINLGAKYIAQLGTAAANNGWGMSSVISSYNAGGSADRPGDGKRATNRVDGLVAAGGALAPFVNQTYVDRVLGYYEYFKGQPVGIGPVTVTAIHPAVWLAIGVAALLLLGQRK